MSAFSEPFDVFFSPGLVVLLRLWPRVSKIIILGALSHLFLSPDIFAVFLYMAS